MGLKQGFGDDRNRNFKPTTLRGNVVFTGTYKRSLDGKLRVLLPKRLRSELPTETSLFLTPGTDHCLELHTRESLNELAVRAEHSSAGSKKVRSFSRLFYSRAEPCDVDKQGRIRIPLALAQLADLEKEVAFVGVGFHWELWNLELWESYLGKNQDAFDRIAETTFDSPADPNPAWLSPKPTATRLADVEVHTPKNTPK